MSYTRGMGSTATDIAAVSAAAAAAAASLIGAATGTSPASTAATIDPATGLPYGTINPATGLPYGTLVTTTETSYMPIVIGGIVLVGIGGYFLMRKRSTPNRRRMRRNSVARGSKFEVEYPGGTWGFPTKKKATAFVKKMTPSDKALATIRKSAPSRGREGW